MSKVICDICGTTYQDTAECCPICGYPRDVSGRSSEDEFVMEEMPALGKGGRFSASKKKKEIFDFDEESGDFPETENGAYTSAEAPDGGEDEQSRNHNTFAVIVLTVLIVVLLAGTVFLFFRFLLPNLHPEKETVPVTETEPTQTEAVTTELRIPCQSLSLPGGAAELTQPGYYFLLNVVVKPEDTTDELVFTSGNENIATVSADGRITAVGEGETVIYITCGDKQLTCPVTCRFVEETEPPTAETVETTSEATMPQVELKLDRTDMRLMVGYGTQLKLVDCGDLQPEDVEWSVEHSYIAKVENGYVTALQNGTTEVTAKYGDQEVKCLVRCYS